MRVVIVGGGPAGLYLAVLLRHIDPAGDVVVVERRGPGEADGSGIEMPEGALARLRAADPATYDHLAQRFERWDDIEVRARGQQIRSHGHGFVGIARSALLRVLAERADALGAEIRYDTEVGDATELEALGLGDADLIVAADGSHSRVREINAERFGLEVEQRPMHVLWLATTRRTDASTYLFEETPHGLVHAQAFPCDDGRSAFIIQCGEETWRALGLDAREPDDVLREMEAVFSGWLEGHPLVGHPHAFGDDASHPFSCVTNDRWYDGRHVLLGDAAHTTYFAGHLGTRLVLEDALTLALALKEYGANEAALALYEAERKAEAIRWQRAARETMEWFEHVDRSLTLPIEQFAYGLITRTEQLSHETLRARDPEFVADVERAVAGVTGDSRAVPPPMFTTYALRGCTLPNRVVVAPVDLYAARDGMPGDFHLAHYGARGLGGAGLVVTEMTAVAPDARITPGSTGIYDDAQVDAWRRITALVHETSPARICLELGHAGPKGSTKRLWDGDHQPLDGDGWETIGASPIAWKSGMRVPRAMTRADMTRVIDQFVRATQRAAEANFDMIELHAAHGQLLSAFITPLLNQREDEYGGSLSARLRFPLEVFAAVRAAWPADRPMSVCISACDWAPGGVTESDGVAIAAAFRDAGADIIHVSAGGTSPDGHPVYGRMFQTPLSDRVRNEAHVPTMAVGNITDADQVNAIIASGRADLCALGRPHLTNPSWTLHAAGELGWSEQWWPAPYERGRRQLERELQHRVDMFEAGAS